MNPNEWTVRQKSILAICALAIILDGFDTQAIGFAAPSLIADWTITKADLAPIFGIGLLGMALGAAAGGWIGDRLGRRIGMIASTVTFGLATCGMALSSNLWELGAFRFIAGLGLGGALPTATVLVAEFTPPSRRSLAVSISIICIPIGGIVGGLLAAPFLPIIGWRGLLLIAGILPLIVAGIHAVVLPESPSFLNARERRRAGRSDADSSAAARTAEPPRKGFFREIARLGLLGETLALWTAFGASLLSGYLYFNWLPVLLAEAGFALSATSLGLLVYNVGCVVSGIVIGALTTRAGTRLPLILLAAAGAASAIGAMFFPLDPGRSGWLLPLLALQGFTLGGVTVLLYALAVQVFPTPIRSSGIGGSASVGRIGAIISSALGALVLAWGGYGFFLTIGLAMTIGTLALLMIKSRDVEGATSGVV